MVLRLFNPGCELEVANGSCYFHLPKNPSVLEDDLAVIPMYLSQRGDYVVVKSLPDSNFVNFWRNYYDVCFVTADNPDSLPKNAVDGFVPWGISPRAWNIAGKFRDCFSQEFVSSERFGFHEVQKMLFDRTSSASVFRNFIAKSSYSDVYPNISQIPLIAKTEDEAYAYFDFAFKQFGGTVFKALYGSSGRGVRIFRRNELSDNIRQWTGFVIKSQGGVECEPLYNRLRDFSVHFDIVDHKPVFRGFSRFTTSENGLYRCSKVKNFSEIEFFPKAIADDLVNTLGGCLVESIFCSSYCGPLGVDCMIYSDSDGGLKINPCVEINCRYTMGRLALDLEHLVSPNSVADLYVSQKTEIEDFIKHIPVFSEGRLVSGFLRLTPENTKCFVAGILATEL